MIYAKIVGPNKDYPDYLEMYGNNNKIEKLKIGKFKMNNNIDDSSEWYISLDEINENGIEYPLKYLLMHLAQNGFIPISEIFFYKP